MMSAARTIFCSASTPMSSAVADPVEVRSVKRAWRAESRKLQTLIRDDRISGPNEARRG